MSSNNQIIKPYFECEYCFKKLTTQARLDKHTCEPKKRALYLKTPKGLSAFYCYEKWLTCRGFKAPTIDTFIESKYFNAIEKFVKFCNSTAIPDREHYIEYMAENNISPYKWSDVDVYDEYLKYFDKSMSPQDMAKITIDTLFDLADLFDCEIPEVLSHIYASDLMKLVVARKISPWILLLSKSFMEYMKNEVTYEQRLLINATIDYKTWTQKFKENPDTVLSMKKLVNEMEF